MEIQLIVRWIFGAAISSLILIGGIILYAAKPERNNTFGYVRKLSLESEENWNYSNKILSLVMIVAGAVMLAIVITLNLTKVEIKVFMPVFVVSLIVALFCMVWIPGNRLKRYIDKKPETVDGDA